MAISARNRCCWMFSCDIMQPHSDVARNVRQSCFCTVSLGLGLCSPSCRQVLAFEACARVRAATGRCGTCRRVSYGKRETTGLPSQLSATCLFAGSGRVSSEPEDILFSHRTGEPTNWFVTPIFSKRSPWLASPSVLHGLVTLIAFQHPLRRVMVAHTASKHLALATDLHHNGLPRLSPFSPARLAANSSTHFM